MAIISLTTIPSRLETGIEPTIKSLAEQGLDIYLWIPKVFKRNNVKFNGKIPKYLKDYGVKYIVVEDYGSITKLYPALSLSSELIITADDDVIYPASWARNLINAYEENPHKAYCYRGRKFRLGNPNYKRTILIRNKPEPMPVDIVTGIWGVLYNKKFFKEDFVLPKYGKPEYYVDDIWISGYLASKNISRICLPNPGIESHDIHKLDALTHINWSRGNNNNTETVKKFNWNKSVL